MRRILLLFLSLIMVSCIFFVITGCNNPNENSNPNDITNKNVNGLKLDLNTDGSYYVVTGLNDLNTTEIIIPDVHNGVPIKEIKDSAFENNIQVNKLVIPESVVKIGIGAFIGCTNITHIEVPAAALEFIYSNSLISVSIINGIIPDMAFYNCSLIEEVSISDKVIKIGDKAFDGCNIKKLTCSLEFLDNVDISWLEQLIINKGTKIPDYCFYQLDSLTYVKISNTVVTIGCCAFYGCLSLKTIEFEEDSVLEEIDLSAFVDCESLEDIILPNSLKYIGDSAFHSCKSLTSIMIPSSVIHIGSTVFAYCDSLTEIKIEEKNLLYKAIDNIIYSKDGSVLVLYPAGKEDASFIIPNTVSEIEDMAFISCCWLEKVVIPSNVSVVGDDIFSDCDWLTIYCEVDSCPSSWVWHWNYYGCPVVWGYKGE